jgi:hypothetical protein
LKRFLTGGYDPALILKPAAALLLKLAPGETDLLLFFNSGL